LVPTVPVPSEAVVAALTLIEETLGVPVKIGELLAGIVLSLLYIV
jgi:hypothetical protein